MIRLTLVGFFLFLASVAGLAQDAGPEPVPPQRFLYAPDTDFPGGDLATVFDTTEAACARACAANPACAAFTFNARAGACFPKSGVTTTAPYIGAISARKQATDPAVLARSGARLAALSFVTAEDQDRARALVAETARAFPAALQSEADVVAALAQAMSGPDYTALRRAAGTLASLSDSTSGWLNLSIANLRLPDTLPRSLRNTARRDAIPAALNAVLRAASEAEEATALEQLATALQANRRGKDSVTALRRAVALSPRSELQDRLDDAIGKYGFRVTGHQIDNDSAEPRICAEFSEPLARSGVEYDSYVQVPGLSVVTDVSGSQLCLLGVAHGAAYDVTFRAGLPAASGEVTHKATRLDLYVRDRPATVRFPGRGYVLPRLDGAALPVTVVNAGTLDLVLREVSDRNVLRAMQDNLFARPLSSYAEDRFASDIATEIWRGTAEVETALNRDSTTRLPLGEMLAGRGPGIYALTARVQGADRYDGAGATQWFVLSDLGLTSLQGTDGLHVALRGLSDAQAREGVEVTLISRANAVLARAETDAQGFVRFPAGVTRGQDGAAPALLLARAEDDMAFLRLTEPAFDLSDRGVEGRAAPGPVDAYLALDRGAYRAGEEIGATVLLRDSTGTAAVDGLPLTAVLQRPDGVDYSRTLAPQSAAGGYVFRLPIGADVPRGTWRLDIGLGDDAPPLASTTLLVEDFLPERIDVDLALPDGPVPRAGLAALDVTARYLFGAPGADLAVEGDLRLRPVRSLEGWPGYEFGRHDSEARAQGRALGPVRTDAGGLARLPITLPVVDEDSVPMMAEMTVRVAEGSGRPVERRISREVARSGPVVGLKPGFDGIAAENSAAGFDLVALAPDGAAQAGTVSWVLNRIDTRYQWYQLYGNWNWEPITRRTRIATGAVTLDGAPGRLLVPVEWGDYELIAVLDGTQSAASVRFSAGWYGSGDSTQTPDRLQVGLDKPGYAVGDTALLQIDAARGGTAFVTVLTSAVVHREIVEVPDGGARVPLEVTQDWGSSAYVTVSLLRPVTGDDPAPARALGLAHAAVSAEAHQLEVTLDAPEVTDGQPGDTEVAVQVAGLDPGQNAHVTLAAVDLGILNLTAHDSPDPLGHFFGQRRLGVDIRDLYGRLIDGQAGPLGLVRSGGDAGAQMRMQAPPPAEANMVFFSGLVQTDAEGRARITVPRPAFNGTIRLDAVAWTGSAVGQASREIVARDPVVVTASLPRFLAPGDQSRLLLEVQPTEAQDGAADLRIDAPGLTLGDVAQTVSLTEGRLARVEVPITAQGPGNRTLTATLTLADGTELTKDLRLRVQHTDPEIATTRRLALGPGNTFRFDGEVFAGLRTGSGAAVLSAGPLARLDVPGLIDLLDRVPYGCTEQITSAALPLLYLSAYAPERDMRERVDTAIARVLTRQTSAGGFGLWRAESGELWLDAYVTDFLLRARDAGHDVPGTALQLALNNLQNRINYAPDFDAGGEDVAYALYLLAREGAASVADLRYYADAKRQAFSTAQARAQLGAALASYGDTLRADAMFRAAVSELDRTTAGRVWRPDFGSALSDRAAVLRYAVEARTNVVDTGALARSLPQTRSLSTQDAAQVLLAADSLRGADSLSGLTVNGTPATGPVVHRLRDGAGGAPVAITNVSDTPVDITLTTFGVPEIAPEAGGLGYAITRRMFSPEGAEVSGPFTAGEQRIVVLSVTPFEEVGARLMVEDPLPAGLEIDNPNLLRSGAVRGLDWLDVAPTQSEEFLSDRFRAALDVRGTETVHLAYKLRAVTPGRYHHPAASVHDMYRPDFRAVTGTGRLDVLR